MCGVYFMTFIDISYRLAVKTTCTNRICNISGFRVPLPVLQNYYGLIWLAILDLWEGGLFYDFCWYLLPFGRKGYFYKPEMQFFGFWGPRSGFARFLWSHLIHHLRLMGVYLMTFIDTPFRLAVKATCTNRKCNVSVFAGPSSGFENKLWAHLIQFFICRICERYRGWNNGSV